MDHIQQERHFGWWALIEANAKTKYGSVVQLVDIGADRVCKDDDYFVKWDDEAVKFGSCC
jgi:hypothetical protein